jgi:predicted NBD/HSP70 family sugar kinase/biotin operon repressor
VIESMLRLRRASRVELSRESGMSQPTVSRIVDQLLNEGVLVETSEDRGNSLANPSLGRPSTPLALDHSKPRFAAIHVGVDKTRLATLPLAIAENDQWAIEFATPRSADRWAHELTHAWKQLRARHLEAAIVSLPGVVDQKAGRVFLSPNLRWTETADLPALLAPICRMPLIFVQELAALAMGQLALEPATRDFLLIDFGSGVGAAAVAGGKLYSGPLPLSGEVGHIPVLGNKRSCGCGSAGCLETLVSRKGLLTTASEAKAGDSWEDLLQSLQGKRVPEWIKPSLEATAVTIAAALNTLGLREVILTGYTSDFPPHVIEYLSDCIRADAMWARFGSVTVRTAPRRRLAGILSVGIERTLLNTR